MYSHILVQNNVTSNPDKFNYVSEKLRDKGRFEKFFAPTANDKRGTAISEPLLVFTLHGIKEVYWIVKDV